MSNGHIIVGPSDPNWDGSNFWTDGEEEDVKVVRVICQEEIKAIVKATAERCLKEDTKTKL